MITVSIFIILYFFFESYNILILADNDHTEIVYPIVFGVILAIYLVAVVLVLIYLVGQDSQTTRALVPWGIIIAGFASVLIALWVILYFAYFYHKDYAYVTKYDSGEIGSN